MRHTYQETTGIVLVEVHKNFIDFSKVYYQNYFYELKINNPKLYDNLFFDTNGHAPFSQDLESILRDLFISGLVDFDRKLTLNGVEEAKELIESEKELQ